MTAQLVAIVQKDTDVVLALCSRAAGQVPKDEVERKQLLGLLVGASLPVEMPSANLRAEVELAQLAVAIVEASQVDAAFLDPQAHHLVRDPNDPTKPPALQAEPRVGPTGNFLTVTGGAGGTFEVKHSGGGPPGKTKAWILVTGTGGTGLAATDVTGNPVQFSNLGVSVAGDYLVVALVTGHSAFVGKVTLP